MNGPNIPMFRKLVEWVEEQDQFDENDREWRQESWLRDTVRGKKSETNFMLQNVNFCGTQVCVAGKAALLDGWTPVFTTDEVGVVDSWYTMVVEKDGFRSNLDEVATKALNITYEEASYLFEGDNTAKDVRRIAEEICGERL